MTWKVDGFPVPPSIDPDDAAAVDAHLRSLGWFPCPEIPKDTKDAGPAAVEAFLIAAGWPPVYVEPGSAPVAASTPDAPASPAGE